MAIKVRVLLSSIVVLATTSLVGCGHYTCGTTFGNATCASSGSGVSQGGGTGAAAAFAFVDVSGTVDSYTLTTSPASFLFTPNYTGPTIPPNTSGTGMVVAQGQYLYSAFGGTGQIYGWTISSGGGLTAINGSPFSASYMIGSTIGGTQSMITNPAGTLLFVLNPSGDAVYVYQIGSGGVLTAAGLPLLVPFEPENMATDGLGKYLYVGNVVAGDATSEIAAYSIGSSGSLTAVQGSPFSYPMWLLQGDPSGKYLIGTTGSVIGDPHLYVFSIQQTGTNAGVIAPVPGSPFATVYSPYRIAVQPNTGGNLVYSFSLNGIGTGDNPIEGYQLNTSTGALTAISGSPFSSSTATGDWGKFDQSGAFLFAYDSATTEMGVFAVGSNGALTQPISTTAFFLGSWAVTDPH